jgi:hypothetical protein
MFECDWNEKQKKLQGVSVVVGGDLNNVINPCNGRKPIMANTGQLLGTWCSNNCCGLLSCRRESFIDKGEHIGQRHVALHGV